MPEVFRQDGLRFFFFSNEGQEPPHVHVEAGDAAAKFWIVPVDLAYSSGFSGKDLRRARLLVVSRTREIPEKWHEHFGS